MYTVLFTGGKQYRVLPGKTLYLEKLDVPEETEFTLPVKNVGPEGIKEGEARLKAFGVEKQDKVIIFKKKRRHNYRRKKGHRQQLLKVKVLSIA